MSRDDGVPTVEDVITDLRTLRSGDPAARSAMHAIALARITLESFWRHDPTSDD